MSKGDDYRDTAKHCRFAAATSSSKVAAETLRAMATEYDGKADAADAADKEAASGERTEPDTLR